MNVWLSLPAPETDISETLATVQVSARLRRVVYEETVAKIRAHSGRIAGLFIPRTLSGIDYDFRYLIEHIRIDQDKRISRLPIVVAVDLDKDFMDAQNPVSTFEEEFYRNIAVVLSPAPDADDLYSKIDEYAWTEFQRHAGSEPFYDKGRHDRANAWGAYIILKVLSATDLGKGEHISGIQDRMQAIESRLLEDTYYKRHIQGLRGAVVDAKSLVDLRSERAKSLSNICPESSVLIVEDQLADGWEAAYSAIFDSGTSRRELIFAADVDTAKAYFQKSPTLIMLDVRLATDRGNSCQNEEDHKIHGMAGVRLAQWFRKQRNTSPIIAATASNKSWTLEALLGYGINGYWIKASPDSARTWDQAIRNVLDLYKKLNATLEWSQTTRPWVDGLYCLADMVFEHDQRYGSRILGKAKSLHALLFDSFSPFQKEMSDGLQLNIAFVLIYSCMNDLVSWILEKEDDDDDGSTTWYLDGDDGRCALVKASGPDKEGDERGRKYVCYDGGENRRKDSCDFPDSRVAIAVLNGLRLGSCASQFRLMTRTRNGLPLVHGKVDEAETTSKSVDRVKESEVSSLIGVLLTLAKEKHSRLSGQARTR